MNTLTILTTTLADRGAEIYPARVRYNYEKKRTVLTPSLAERTFTIPLGNIQTMTGLELRPKEIVSLLKRARYGGKVSANKVTVTVPCYRLDILHQVDIMEDIAIAYGLNNMKPRWPSDLTIGGLSPLEEFCDSVRELMIGLGFQEVLTFVMSNHEKLFSKMNQEPTGVVEIANPKVMTMTTLRHWLLPSLMDFLSSNTHIEYPQKLFEVGDCPTWKSSALNRVEDIRKLACVSAHSRANFTEIKSTLEPLTMNLGFRISLQSASHPSFVPGRMGSILIGETQVGIVGEIHPQVLENWKLEDPVAALELDLSELFKLHRQVAGEAPQPPTSERAN